MDDVGTLTAKESVELASEREVTAGIHRAGGRVKRKVADPRVAKMGQVRAGRRCPRDIEPRLGEGDELREQQQVEEAIAMAEAWTPPSADKH